MNDLQKMGGVAALVEAATFVVGFGLFSTALAPYTTGYADPNRTVAFLVDSQALMYAANLIIYVVFGSFLVVLTLALHERLKTASPATAQVATSFGLIWAGLVIASGMTANIGASVVVDLYAEDRTRAALVWLVYNLVVNGLGGGNETVGGLWALLISWAALQTGRLPRALNYLGMVVGVAGVLTTVPALSELGAVFGLGLIVWFAWVGIVMLRGSPSTSVVKAVRQI